MEKILPPNREYHAVQQFCASRFSPLTRRAARFAHGAIETVHLQDVMRRDKFSINRL